jgi:hypothetical protein
MTDSVSMSWYNTGSNTFKTTTQLHAYNTNSMDWHEVVTCHIYSGGWKMVYSNASLNSFVVYNNDYSCDPTMGQFEATWTYGGDTGGLQIRIQYSWDNSNWVNYGTYDPTLNTSGPQGLDGYVGFTSLDNTYFRCFLEDTTSGASVKNSPRSVSSPYIC